jgi:hypothetical protein
MRVVTWVVACAVLAWPLQASADTEWRLLKKDGRAYLQGYAGGEEADNDFWAQCRADRSIDIGAGAETNVGGGHGEAVTLKLVSAGKTVTLTGVSRNSPNIEMTGGTELRARIARDHPLFALFATGQPIAVSGSIKSPKRWAAKGLKAKAEAFLQGCR